VNSPKAVHRGPEQFNIAETAFNSALADYNEVNLQVIQQQNRIAALKQERESGTTTG
jgi:hypothetical protein